MGHLNAWCCTLRSQDSAVRPVPGKARRSGVGMACWHACTSTLDRPAPCLLQLETGARVCIHWRDVTVVHAFGKHWTSRRASPVGLNHCPGRSPHLCESEAQHCGGSPPPQQWSARSPCSAALPGTQCSRHSLTVGRVRWTRCEALRHRGGLERSSASLGGWVTRFVWLLCMEESRGKPKLQRLLPGRQGTLC